MKLGTAHRGGRDRSLGDPERPVVPGYRALERLGGDPRGGVEVWKAEGPGGFPVALRVVRLTADVTPDSLRGLERLRRARHPNLLAAFGSWRIEGALVLATELPDRSLWDRFCEVRDGGAEGIPRDELLDHVAEAARGIDYVNGNLPGLADHPDPAIGVPLGEVSPRTILFVGGGVKVADIDAVRTVEGRARDLDYDSGDSATPLWGLDYAAPERFTDRGSRHSDQYSLALTYCHLRIGRLPFAAARPDACEGSLPRRPVLADLPNAERPALARALADAADRRWPSCRAFVDALRADILAAEQDRPDELEPELTVPVASAPPVVVAPRPREWRTTGRALTMATGAATLAGTVLLAGRPFPSNRLLSRPVPTTHVVPASAVSIETAIPPRVEPDVVPNLPLPASDVPPPPAAAPALPSSATVPAVAAAVPALVQPVVIPAEEAARPPDGVGVASSLVPGVSAGSAALVSGIVQDKGTVPATTGAVKPTASIQPAIRLEAPPTLVIEAGRTVSFPLTLACNEHVGGTVEVRIQGLPGGVSAMPLTVPAQGGGAASQNVVSLEVRADPNSLEGESLARLLASVGPSQAETLVRVRVEPTPALAARRRGDMLLRREDYQGAVAAYTEAIALDGSNPLAFHGRALAAYGKGDLDPALVDIDASLRLSPDSPTALNNRGLIRLARGENSAAIADFDTAIRLDPAYAVVRYNRGRAYSESAANDPALADFDEAIRLDPKFAKAYKARADVLARKADRDRALADYDEALRLRPDDPAALNNRGLLLFARGDYHRAIADFDEAIRISPRYAVVRYNRGRVYAYLGDTVEALTSFEQAIRLEPTLTRAVQARAELINRPTAKPAARADLGVAAARRETTKRPESSTPPQ